MREKIALSQNVFHNCITCQNRAMHIVKVDFPNEENFYKSFYACDSHNCDALIWLQMAASEEILDYDIEN